MRQLKSHEMMQWWEDTSKIARDEIIKEGAKYFFDKYGVYPKFVWVNKDIYIDNEPILDYDWGEIEVKSDKGVCKDIFWFSVDGKLLEDKRVEE